MRKRYTVRYKEKVFITILLIFSFCFLPESGGEESLLAQREDEVSIQERQVETEREIEVYSPESLELEYEFYLRDPEEEILEEEREEIEVEELKPEEIEVEEVEREEVAPIEKIVIPEEKKEPHERPERGAEFVRGEPQADTSIELVTPEERPEIHRKPQKGTITVKDLPALEKGIDSIQPKAKRELHESPEKELVFSRDVPSEEEGIGLIRPQVSAEPLAEELIPVEKKPKAELALFEFENLSSSKVALKFVMPEIRTFLERNGIAVLDEGALDDFLLKERVRSTGYVSRQLEQKLRNEFGIKYILLGSVNTFSNHDNPKIGISARLVDASNGQIKWANSVSSTGDDFITFLGLGRITSVERLIPDALENLFSLFSVNSPPRMNGSAFRIAVMPFQNKADTTDAGIMATYLFLGELVKAKRFEPVEYGETRRHIVDFRIRERGQLNYTNIESLSGVLGVDGILVGTVEHFSDGSKQLKQPEVAISARLIDAQRKEILWYDRQNFRGDDGIIVLDLGQMRSVDKVTNKVVSNLIKRMESALWQ